jgi:Na+-translocating ferredoxin:NAD+ oxidoreductase RnfG subunit
VPTGIPVSSISVSVTISSEAMPGNTVFRLFSIVVSLLLTTTTETPLAGDIEHANEVVRRVFPGTEEIHTFTMSLSQADLDSLHQVLRQQWPRDSIVILIPEGRSGFAVIDNVKGKDQLITYILSITGGMVVLDLEILAYREPYGGEIRNASWRNQFRGKTTGDRIRVGRDIKNITGATISVRAVTEGVKRILTAMPLITERIAQQRPR